MPRDDENRLPDTRGVAAVRGARSLRRRSAPRGGGSRRAHAAAARARRDRALAPADGAASVLAEELDAGKAAASPPPRENFHQFRFVTKPNPNDEARNDAAAPAETSEIALTWYRGTLVAPASINGAPKLDFIVDSGAADVSITADALETLIKSGAVTDADFLGKKTYKLADGSTVPSQIFRIHSLRVGDREVDNVLAAVNAADGGMLLGQSFLGRLKSWSIDNERRRLLLK